MSLHEYYNTGDDNAFVAASTSWLAQTFKVQTGDAHSVTVIKLKIYKYGTTGVVGTVTVGIRATDGSGHPTGDDLASGTVSGDALSASPTWVEFTMNSLPQLSQNTKYAIVIRAPDRTGDMGVAWRADTSSPTYTDGAYESSNDSGGTWTTTTSRDFMFEEWGGVLPTVTTQAVSNITGATATGNGNITDLGDTAVTAHGVCWNTTGTPTILDSTTDEGAAAATGAFTTSITGITENQRYYLRAYATNSTGTAYGVQVEFYANYGEVSGRMKIVGTTLQYYDKVGTLRYIEGQVV